MLPWKTIDKRTILDYSQFLAVEAHSVQLPDGRVIADWPWLISPDFANVVAVTEGGQLLCFRQVKYGLHVPSLAPVGGYIEPGEPPRQAAERELLEETGYTAEEWVDLGHYQVDGNRGLGTAYFYLALGAHRVAEIDADDLEEQELLLMDREDVERALLAGEFRVLPWAASVAMALQYLARQGKP